MKRLRFIIALLLCAVVPSSMATTPVPPASLNDNLNNPLSGGARFFGTGTSSTNNVDMTNIYIPMADDAGTNCMVSFLSQDAVTSAAAETWDSVSLTSAPDAGSGTTHRNPVSNAAPVKLWGFSLTNPNTGAKVLHPTWTTNARSIASTATFRGIDPNGCGANLANADVYSATATSTTASITFTAAVGDIVVMGCGVNSSNLSSPTGTSLFTAASFRHAATQYTVATTTTPTLSYTLSSDNWACEGFRLKAAAATAGFYVPPKDLFYYYASASGCTPGAGITTTDLANGMRGITDASGNFRYPDTSTDASPGSYITCQSDSTSLHAVFPQQYGNSMPSTQVAAGSRLVLRERHADVTHASTIRWQVPNSGIVRPTTVQMVVFGNTYAGTSNGDNKDVFVTSGITGNHSTDTNPSMSGNGSGVVNAYSEKTIASACLSTTAGDYSQSIPHDGTPVAFLSQFAQGQQTPAVIERLHMYKWIDPFWTEIGSGFDTASLGAGCSTDLLALIYFGGVQNKPTGEQGKDIVTYLMAGCYRTTEASCPYDINAFLPSPLHLNTNNMDTGTDLSGSASVAKNSTTHICANSYSVDSGTFAANMVSTWGVPTSTGGIDSTMLSATSGVGCVDFTPTVTGTATIEAYDAYGIPALTGTITVQASSGGSRLPVLGPDNH